MTDQTNKLAELKTREAELLKLRMPPRIMCEDITGEKMTVLLQEHGEAMASLSSDARSAIKIILGKYTSAGSDEEAYIKGWSADSTRQDRIGRPAAAVDSAAIALAWAVQPALFDQMFSDKGLAESGLSPRFIVCRAEPDLRASSFDEGSYATEAEVRFAELLISLLSEYRMHHERAHTIAAAAEARAVFKSYQLDIIQRIESGEFRVVASFAMRWAEMAWKLALIFHCAQHGKNAHLHEVDSATASNAVRVMKWFARHQCELILGALEIADNRRAEIALSYVNSRADGATARDLQRHKQGQFPKVADARVVLETLQSNGSITVDYSGRSKRFRRKEFSHR